MKNQVLRNRLLLIFGIFVVTFLAFMAGVKYHSMTDVGSSYQMVNALNPVMRHWAKIKSPVVQSVIGKQISNGVFSAALNYNQSSDEQKKQIYGELYTLHHFLSENNTALSEVIGVEYPDLTAKDKNSMQNYILNSFEFIVQNNGQKDLPYEFMGFSQ